MFRGLTTLFLLATAFTGSAQLGVGFRAGITWANMTFPDVDDDGYGDLNWETTPFKAPTAAIMIDLPIRGRFSLLTELAYQQRGYEHKWSNGPMGNDFTERLVLDYIDLDLLCKFRIGSSHVRPHLLAGPVFGRMLGARMLYSNDEGSFANASGIVLPPDAFGMQRWNIGICGGAGFNFTIGRSSLILEGRYQYGLSNIWNGIELVDQNGSTIGELNGFDRSWSFCIGWGFRLNPIADSTSLASVAPPGKQ
jgi:Outer membrane protein beta-barrel domain